MTTVNLKYPIEFEGGKLTEIKLRRPIVRDIMESKRGRTESSDQEIALIAKLAMLPPSAIEEIDLLDYTAIQEQLQSFFG